MCPTRLEHSSGGNIAAPHSHRTGRKLLSLVLLVFVFTAVTGILSAQSNREEYDLVKTFSLPKIAVPISELQLENDVYLKDGYPFNGIAYEKFENGKLSRLISLLRGLHHGPMYLWYMDGMPQMSANYRSGKLQGRFLGWYRNGGIIYDMAINHNGYTGDYLTDDGTRASDESPDTEVEGSDMSNKE